jgi:CHAT domain-containing protein
VEAAITLSPRSPEALFNRALVLERLNLGGLARQAWRDVLAEEQESGWEEEAARRLANSHRTNPRLIWRQNLNAFMKAESRNSPVFSKVVAVFPQEAREYVSEELFASWGHMILARHSHEAAVQLTVAREIGAAIAEATADMTVRDIVRVIECTADRELDEQARAQIDYAEGMASFRKSDTKAAERHLAAAAKTFRRLRSPLALWTATTRAAIAEYGHRPNQAVALLEYVLRRVAPYPALAGRAEWYRGLIEAKEGRLGSALIHYRLAVDRYMKLGERENLGAVQGLVAEALGLLGDHDEAWTWRLHALATLRDFSRSLRLHNLLRESADAALQIGEPGAALAFQTEGVEVAMRIGEPALIAEAFIWRSRIEIKLGHFTSASNGLERARVKISRQTTGTIQAKLEADRLLVAAELETSRGHSATAVGLLHSAIAQYRLGGAELDLAIALLARAESELDLGRDVFAEQDQQEAIALFEQQRAAVEDKRLLVSSAGAAEAIFDRMIRLQVERRHRPDRALEFAERARLLASGNLAASENGPTLEKRFSTIPVGVTVVEFALLDDQLYTWVLTRGQFQFTVRKLSSQQLAGQIEALVASLSHGSKELTNSWASRLFDELIPPAVTRLPPGTPLVIVPDKALNALPFAVLVHRTTGRYLVEDYPITFVPSLRYASERWSRPKDQPGSWRATLVGNPAFDQEKFPNLTTLPGADREVDAITHVYSEARLLRGKGASPSAILASFANSEIVHFAGHSISVQGHPDLSYLVAAPEPANHTGILLARDLSSSRFPNLRLVVLSACSTLGPTLSRATGIAGIAEPLLESGASAVVGSLWNIDDRTGSYLFRIFHTTFREDGDAAQALREAQLSMLHEADPALSSPAAWGAFQVYGLLEPQTH